MGLFDRFGKDAIDAGRIARNPPTSKSPPKTHSDARAINNFGEVVRHPYAGFWRRVAAFLIDCLILNVIGFFLTVCLLLLGFDTLAGLANVALSVYYFVSLDSSAAQATPGKRIFGIKVIHVSGKTLTRRRAGWRFCVGWFLTLLFLGLPFLWMIFSKRKQAMHDVLFDTLVVKQ